jgi:inorganic pyrophosphatase/exopolyphosphatase
MYSREVINEMNALSKEVFGTTSKWKKMVEKGVAELVEEDIKKLSIKDGKEVTEIVKTPKLRAGPGGGELHQSTLKRYTVEEAREFLLLVKDRRTQVQAAIKRIEEQQKVEKAAKEEAEKASGTAV